MALQNISQKIIKQPDKKIINAVYEAAQNAEYTITQVNFSLKIGGEPFIGNLESLNLNAEFNKLLNLTSEVISRFTFNTDSNFNITISRVENSSYDSITLNFASLQDDQRDKANKFYSDIREKIRVIDSSRIIQTELNEQLKRHYEIREFELSKLESISESLIDRTEKYLKQKQEEFAIDKSNLEIAFQNKNEILISDFEKKKIVLEEERNKLDLKLKEIDDRESKHVRRKIREDLKEELKKRSQKFGLTEGTIKLRKPVYYFSFILLLLFGAGFIIYSYLSIIEVLKDVTNSSHLIALGIKQLALGLAFGSTAVFFIRWNNKWFEKHSNEEFRLKRHEIDLDRASWLVEMAFEWKSEKGTDIPMELINKLGQNLFEEEKTEEQPLHPSDQLASAILGAASNVSVKVPGGAELSLDRKGINKLNKA